MEIENYRLRPIRAFVFDVDGVLTDGNIYMNDSGEHLRSYDVKDGFAIKRAMSLGFPVVIISGHNHESQRRRLEELGITHIHLGVKDKLAKLRAWCDEHNISLEDTLYLGDDLPDYEVMRTVGLAVCPKDAVTDIKNISHYVSRFDGGRQAVRDVIEATLKAQEKWVLPEPDHTDEGSNS